MKIIKKIIYYVGFPFVFLWIVFSFVLFFIGICLQKLGNKMSGGEIEKSIGSAYLE